MTTITNHDGDRAYLAQSEATSIDVPRPRPVGKLRPIAAHRAESSGLVSFVACVLVAFLGGAVLGAMFWSQIGGGQ